MVGSHQVKAAQGNEAEQDVQLAPRQPSARRRKNESSRKQRQEQLIEKIYKVIADDVRENGGRSTMSSEVIGRALGVSGRTVSRAVAQLIDEHRVLRAAKRGQVPTPGQKFSWAESWLSVPDALTQGAAQVLAEADQIRLRHNRYLARHDRTERRPMPKASNLTLLDLLHPST